MRVILELEQGTAEWLQARCGRPTASRFSDIITAAKGDLSKSAKGYIRELIGQTFCPEWSYVYKSAEMQRGNDLEPEARAAFCEATGLTVAQVGFCVRDDGISGCSPDGLITDSAGEYMAGIEIKCPSPKTHIEYVMDGGLPDAYKQQVHGSMAVTGLTEWHFWSYFPGMKPHHVIVHWDDYTEKLATSLDAFVEEYKQTRAIAMPKLQITKA
jgi:hypothetical protein